MFTIKVIKSYISTIYLVYMHNYLILYQIPSILPIVKALVIQELAIQEMTALI